jgi:hypothetical protein
MSPAVASKPVLNNRPHKGPRLPWAGPVFTCCWASDTRTAMDLALCSSGLGNYQRGRVGYSHVEKWRAYGGGGSVSRMVLRVGVVRMFLVGGGSRWPRGGSGRWR